MIVNRGSSGGGGAAAVSLPASDTLVSRLHTVTVSDTVPTLASGWSY